MDLVGLALKEQTAQFQTSMIICNLTGTVHGFNLDSFIANLTASICGSHCGINDSDPRQCCCLRLHCKSHLNTYLVPMTSQMTLILYTLNVVVYSFIVSATVFIMEMGYRFTGIHNGEADSSISSVQHWGCNGNQAWN